MEDQKKEVRITPIEALAYCQNKLGNIPVTVSQYSTVAQPISEVVVILEQVKQALAAQASQPEAQPEPEKPAPKKKQAQKVVPLPKAEA